jgi:hypothetical protein
MLCEDGIELKKRMDDAWDAYRANLNTSQTGTTREHMSGRTLDLLQKHSYAKKEFDYHVLECETCAQTQKDRDRLPLGVS